MRVHKMLMNGTGRTFIQETPESDVHTQYGRIRASEINGKQDGTIVHTDKGEALLIYTPQWIDTYKRIRRDAQIITFKDAGIILATAGLGPHTTIVEAGAGSGAMTCFLAQHCKHVHTYDISSHNLAVAKENAELLGLSNISYTQHDITIGLLHEADAILLDMPTPWEVFDKLQHIRIGGYVITYTPSAVQLQKTRNEAEKQGLLHIRSIEVTERHWMVREEAVRPTSQNTAFTAFICFFRYMGEEWKSIRPRPNPKGTKPSLPSEELMEEMFA